MDKLKNTFTEFTKAISKIHLLGTVSDKIFDDFPENLPQIVRDSWREKTKKIIFPQEDKKAVKLDFDDFGFLSSIINVMPSKGQTSDFTQVILRQDFINYIAYLEALMQDIQRFIFTNDPKLLPEEKEIKWKEIIGKTSMNEVLEYVIDKQLEKSGYDKISNQIERLNNKPFLFAISIKKKELEKLDSFIAIRNLILHNGNKITNDYLEINPSTLLKYGDVIVLTRSDLNSLHILVQRIAYETYASIGYKLFNIDKKKLYDEMSYDPKR